MVRLTGENCLLTDTANTASAHRIDLNTGCLQYLKHGSADWHNDGDTGCRQFDRETPAVVRLCARREDRARWLIAVSHYRRTGQPGAVSGDTSWWV